METRTGSLDLLGVFPPCLLLMQAGGAGAKCMFAELGEG